MTPRQLILAIANAGTLSGSFLTAAKRPHTDLWQKVGLIPEGEPFIMVSPGVPSNLEPMGDPWTSPEEVVVPVVTTGELCEDLLQDQAAFLRVVGLCAQAPSARIMAQVYSRAVEEVVGALRQAGVNLISDNLPLVSGHTVQYWNTKVGGRDFLRGVRAIRDHLPAAVVCGTIDDVAALVASDLGRGFVVKADTSVGGSGVRLLPAGCSRDAAHIFQAPLPAIHWVGRKKGPPPAAPYLVEGLIGVPGENLTPTVDFRIGGGDEIDCLGIGNQILGAHVAYCGVTSMPVGSEQAATTCVLVGRSICAALLDRGYRGPVNLDFVVDDNGRVMIAEMNLRHSAPLDQFVIVRRLSASEWQRWPSFRCDEGVPMATAIGDRRDAAALLHRGLNLSKDEVVCPVAVGTASDPPARWVSLLTVAASPDRVAELASRARDALA